MDFLKRLVETAQAAGARRFRFADTLGVLEPFGVFERIAALRAVCDLEIEMHAHDDLGMATANTLAAVRAGATHVNTTVNGLGERAGNAPLEEVVLGLRQCHGIETGIDLRKFPPLSEKVACAAGRPVPWQKSVVGEGVFTHEAGIHVDGLLKDPDNYQGFDPQLVCRSHRLVLGKHSGLGGVLAVYAQLGRTVTPAEAAALLSSIRDFVDTAKRAPAHTELLSMLDYLRRNSMTAAAAFASDIAELESAEDFLDYFEVAYDRSVVQVNRLHILQRFHDYLAKSGEEGAPGYAEYRACLALAYSDFVKSDAITEKVFKVLQRASGVATVPVSAIGRAGH